MESTQLLKQLLRIISLGWSRIYSLSLKTMIIAPVITITLSLSGCYYNDRVEITGGTYRFVTKNDSNNIEIIRPFSESDSILGIEVLLSTRFVSTRKSMVSFPNTHTEGLDGVDNRIESVIFLQENDTVSKDVFNSFSGKNERVHLKYNCSRFLNNYTPRCFKMPCEEYETNSYSTINEYINTYNKNDLNLTSSFNLRKVVYFWKKNEHIINEDLSIIISFDNGNKVVLNPNKTPFCYSN